MTDKDQKVKAILKKSSLSNEDMAILEKYEPNEASQDILYSFFTPVWLCQVMYDLAKRNGFKKNGKVLEPACGTGNMISVLDNPQNCTAFELNPINFEIAKKRVPKATYFNQYFETAFLQKPRFRTKMKTKDFTWLKDYPFDLVIGNPPYGDAVNKYSPYFRSPKLNIKRIEMFFMYQGLLLLKPGGLLVFITGSNFMRNDKTYTKEKQWIGEYAEFVDAYRMPKVFKNTGVPTDILIFRRK
jgi:type I restriction-modification system DNA methylase subunit